MPLVVKYQIMKSHLRQGADYIVGIDEAGRGPLAGPVCVGVVVIPMNKYNKITQEFVRFGVRDSKKLSPDLREEIFEKLCQSSISGKICFTKSFIGANKIDRDGISYSIRNAVKTSLKRLKLNPHKTFVYLDGSLKAPENYKQITVIKGDDKVPIISMASVVAKVTRDKYMEKAHLKYPKYQFEKHKGYGTKLHRDLIRKHGLSELHRETYCSKIT